MQLAVHRCTRLGALESSRRSERRARGSSSAFLVELQNEQFWDCTSCYTLPDHQAPRPPLSQVTLPLSIALSLPPTLTSSHSPLSPAMSGISFKIAAPPRPSSNPTARGSAPPSRPSSRNRRSQPTEDDSDEDEEDGLAARARKKRDELVTGFDKEGVTK